MPNEVDSNYLSRLREADRNKYAPEVVGDGSSGVVGPFERSLERVASKDVVPLVVAGWYGESNAGFSDILEKLARLAANGPEAEGISPLDNSDRRGGG